MLVTVKFPLAGNTEVLGNETANLLETQQIVHVLELESKEIISKTQTEMFDHGEHFSLTAFPQSKNQTCFKVHFLQFLTSGHCLAPRYL